jgi:cytochrome P450
LRHGRPIPGTPYAHWISAGEQIHDAFVSLLRQRRAAPKADVLSALLNAREETTGEPIQEEDLVGEVLGLYGAGYETTAYTLAFTLILLATHPKEARSVRDELEGVLGGRAATFDDLPRLPLLNAAILESQRILTVVPISLPRVAAHPTCLAGVTLPAGTLATGALLASHHDPDVFPEPRRFRPSRWDTLDPAHLTYQYLPYGAGPRRCLGAAFADLQLRVTLSVLLQRFAFETAPRRNRIDVKTVQVTMGTRGPALLAAVDAKRGRANEVAISGNIRRLVDFGPVAK